MEDAHVAWCRNLFDMIAEGGVWGVPRSGLVFRKQSGCLVLQDRMPYDPDMIELGITEEQLQEQQDGDFEAIRTHFEAAGIPVKS